MTAGDARALAAVLAIVAFVAFGATSDLFVPDARQSAHTAPAVSTHIRKNDHHYARIPTNPLSSRVKVDRPEGHLQNTEAHSSKEDTDKEIAEFTHQLVWVGIAQAVILATQVIALAIQAGFLWGAFKEGKIATGIARDAMIAGERAFAFATSISPFWEKDTSGQYHWRFRPQWENSGDTPTRNMIMHTEYDLRSTSLAMDFDFNYPTNEVGTALIAPKQIAMGGIVPRVPSPAISPQDLIDIQAGRKILYFWGLAKYYDVFPGTPQHITRFCWSILPVGNPLDPGEGTKDLRFTYLLHAKGNCADDECTQQNDQDKN